jgi:hypothetical protein
VLSDSLLNGILFHRYPPDKPVNINCSSVDRPSNAFWLIVWAVLALTFSLAFLVASEISWEAEGATRGTPCHLTFIPVCYLVLTYNIQVSMWWTNLCLRIRGFIWTDKSNLRLLSSPVWLSELWQPRPPEQIDRESPTGCNKKEQRDKQFQRDLEELARGRSITDRLLHHSPKNAIRNYYYELYKLQLRSQQQVFLIFLYRVTVTSVKRYNAINGTDSLRRRHCAMKIYVGCDKFWRNMNPKRCTRLKTPTVSI